ncbi:MAG: TonB-dependent receptor [Bacteroidales bacterium]
MKARGLPTEIEGFYTMDLINRFKINRNFHAFLIINNLFNAKYGGIDAYGGINDLKYNPQYGRNFRLGFSFTME